MFTASVDENQQIFSEELKDICFRTEKDIMELKLELWSILAMKLLVADNIWKQALQALVCWRRLHILHLPKQVYATIHELVSF